MTFPSSPSPIEQSIEAGFARAAEYDVPPSPQGAVFQALTSLNEERPVLAPLAMSTLAETLTVAGLARAARGGATLEPDDTRFTFNFWEWLFNGAKDR